MTEDEFIEEIIFDKLQTGEYIEIDGVVYDFETGEIIRNINL